MYVDRSWQKVQEQAVDWSGRKLTFSLTSFGMSTLFGHP